MMNQPLLINRTRAIKILRDLISIKSINPLGQPPKSPDYTEKAIAEYVKAFLTHLGLNVATQTVFKDRQNIIGVLPGKNHARNLLLETHMDTVPVQNFQVPPFSGIIKNGKIYGRGACDAKGSLSAMLLAIELLVTNKIQPASTITLAAVVDDEYAYSGVRHLIDCGLKATASIVGEPTDLNIAIAHKGYIRCKIETIGKATHSAVIKEGINAIEKMNLFIHAIKQKLEPKYLHKNHPLLGHPTINIGIIQGGYQANIVPDSCIIDIDRRTLPHEKPQEVLAEFEAIIKELKSQNNQFQAQIYPPYSIDLPMDLSPDESIVQKLKEVTQKIHSQAQIIGVPYTTDASKLFKAGIPTVIFGPGSIAQAHSPNEYVEINQLIQAAQILAQLAVQF